MVEFPDHALALHLPVRDVQYCLMILDELLLMSLLTSITIKELTVSANAKRSLSRPLDQRLRKHRERQVIRHV